MDDFTRRMLDSSPSSAAASSALPAAKAASTSSFHHKAATYAVIAVPACVVLNAVLAGVLRDPALSASPAFKLILAALPGLVMLSALPAGIIALCGIPKHGRKALLWKGLVGVIAPLLLIALAVPAFLKVKQMSEERARQQQQQSR